MEETSCSCAANASASAGMKEGREKGIIRHRSVIPQTKRRELSSSEHSLPPPPPPPPRVFSNSFDCEREPVGQASRY